MRKNVANLRQRIREMFIDDEEFKTLNNDEKVKVIEEKAADYLEQLKTPLIKMAIKRLINDISGKKRVSVKFIENGDLFKKENLLNKTITAIDLETSKQVEVEAKSSTNEQVLNYLLSMESKTTAKTRPPELFSDNINLVRKKIELEGAQALFMASL